MLHFKPAKSCHSDGRPASIAAALVLLVTMTQIGWQAWHATFQSPARPAGPTGWRVEYYSASLGTSLGDHLPPPEHSVYNMISEENDGEYGVAERDSAVELGLVIEGYNVKSTNAFGVPSNTGAPVAAPSRFFQRTDIFEMEGDVITEIDSEA